MTETPQAKTPQSETTGAQMPQQTRGQERITPQAQTAGHRADVPEEPSGWTGWIVFAASMMIMVGAFEVVAGFTALLDPGYFAVSESGLLVNVDYNAWGWTHMALGVIAIAAALGLLAGQMWARIAAVAMALVTAVVNLAFIAAYPLWSLAVIAFCVLVIYAVTVYGGEMKRRVY